MNAQDVLELVRAGYTKEEINTLLGDSEPTPATKPTPATEPTPTQSTEPTPATEPKQAAINTTTGNVTSDEMNKLITGLKNEIELLRKATQSANRSGSNVRTLIENTDDILAGLINPKKS